MKRGMLKGHFTPFTHSFTHHSEYYLVLENSCVPLEKAFQILKINPHNVIGGSNEMCFWSHYKKCIVFGAVLMLQTIIQHISVCSASNLTIIFEIYLAPCM